MDQGQAANANLGCVYVSDAQLTDMQALNATWTHGVMVERILSSVARAELVRHGFAVFGRAPLQVLPQMTDDDLKEAARGGTGLLEVGREAALDVAGPCDRRPGIDVYGSRSAHVGNRRAADENAGHRTGRLPLLAARPVARQEAR